jgi:hypothetical protein
VRQIVDEALTKLNSRLTDDRPIRGLSEDGDTGVAPADRIMNEAARLVG